MFNVQALPIIPRCRVILYSSHILVASSLIKFSYLFHYSETSSGTFPYCTEPGLNFSATNYSEDDADFAGNRRGKASRVSHEN